MRILIDECCPGKKLKFELMKYGHQCQTIEEAGLKGTTNGQLLDAANGNFDVLITVEQSMGYQQDFSKRRICLLVICARTNDIEDIRPQLPEAAKALEAIEPGTVVYVGTYRRHK